MAFPSRKKRSRGPPRAATIAGEIGFPVVAKVVSAEILHKSDIGGVLLHLTSASRGPQGLHTITARVGKLKGQPKLDGVLIAQQVEGDLELAIGAALESEMGPVVLFGSGGVDIELMKDFALAAAPLDATAAATLIHRTKAGVKLGGYRGRPALHEASAVKAIVGLGNLIADAKGRIASIDVNRFLINSRAGVAVDALIVLNPCGCGHHENGRQRSNRGSASHKLRAAPQLMLLGERRPAPCPNSGKGPKDRPTRIARTAARKLVLLKR